MASVLSSSQAAIPAEVGSTPSAVARGIQPAFSDDFPQPNKHMPGLDSLRGIAVTAVVVFHGLGYATLQYPEKLTHAEYALFQMAGFGYLGVSLFFVLSGFLITGILLDTRTDRDYFKTFYIRRILRILPAYVSLIAILKLANHISWAFVLVSLLYVCNLTHSVLRGAGYPVLWSLSVEEQFYLVWPFIIRKLSPRYSFYLAVALVIGTPILRFALLQLPSGFNDIHYKPWAVADFFAAGALLSMMIRSCRMRPLLPRICTALLLLGFACLVLWWEIPPPTTRFGQDLISATFFCPWVFLFSAAVLAAFLVPAVASTAAGRVFAFLGYISYGLYLCHPFIQSLIEPRWSLFRTTGNTFLSLLLLRFILTTAVSIACAWLSRRTIEEFFLRQKPLQRETLDNLQISA